MSSLRATVWHLSLSRHPEGTRALSPLHTPHHHSTSSQLNSADRSPKCKTDCCNGKSSIFPAPRSTDTPESLLHCAVDLRNSTHKFVILDVSQRLGADRWSAIARRVAIKKMIKIFDKEMSAKRVFREIRLMRMVHHRNVS